jgi:hypothetical protein
MKTAAGQKLRFINLKLQSTILCTLNFRVQWTVNNAI